jgi:Domain of unknown function (DUF4263)
VEWLGVGVAQGVEVGGGREDEVEAEHRHMLGQPRRGDGDALTPVAAALARLAADEGKDALRVGLAADKRAVGPEPLVDAVEVERRIVGSGERLPAAIWNGKIPRARASATADVGEGTIIEACELDVDWRELIARLTFGAFGPILDLQLADGTSPFWMPVIVQDLGFTRADRAAKRFFHHLELDPHVDDAAWDKRAIPVRVSADVRRDFIAAPLEPGGRIRVPGPQASFPVPAPPTIADQLPALASAVAELREALEADPPPDEAVMQTLFETHPVLLNVYGRVIPQPRLEYPEGGGPTRKTFVEPDFIIVEDLVSGPRYELIEIERPGKQMATAAGHSRVDLTQAAWQIAEWRAYIANHYDLIRDRYPGISMQHRSTIIISRATERSFGRAEIQSWIELARTQLRVDDILLYDDVLRRAQSALDRLVATTVKP